jgi:hypothetical protein
MRPIHLRWLPPSAVCCDDIEVYDEEVRAMWGHHPARGGQAHRRIFGVLNVGICRITT